MFNKIVDVLKEVFWIKPSRPKKKSVSKKSVRIRKKTPKPPAKSVKKISKVKSASLKTAKPAKKTRPLDPNLVKVGEITHYFDRIKVGVVKITAGTILIGDKLTMAGDNSRFVQKVWSMQIESQDVKVAKKGQLIGLKLDKPVAVGNLVYK